MISPCIWECVCREPVPTPQSKHLWTRWTWWSCHFKPNQSKIICSNTNIPTLGHSFWPSLLLLFWSLWWLWRHFHQKLDKISSFRHFLSNKPQSSSNTTTRDPDWMFSTESDPYQCYGSSMVMLCQVISGTLQIS